MSNITDEEPVAVPATWEEALADYQARRARSDAFPLCDPDGDRYVDVYAAAMDHLIENVRAPSVEAFAYKIELVKERDCGACDEWLDAFVADMMHLCSPGARQVDPEAKAVTEQCSTCRFWLLAREEGCDPGSGWGWCRRNAPQISDHMAAIAMGRPTFGHQYDPEDIAGVVEVADSSLFPATWYNRWCGQYEAAPVDPPGAAAFDAALAEYQRLRAIELAVPSGDTIEEEQAHAAGLQAACDATQEAFDAMIVIPVEDGPSAAAKLRAIDEFYELGACGIDRKALNQVLREIDAALCGGAL